MSISTIEHVSLALVREFLKRKGLTATYQRLDEESPKTEHSITNRTRLAKCLHVDRLLKRNKDEINPLKTILEIITKYLMENDPSHLEKPSDNQALVIEDDLETETFMGRGMENIIQEPSPVTSSVYQPKTVSSTHRRPQKAHYIQEDESGPASRYFNGPSELTTTQFTAIQADDVGGGSSSAYTAGNCVGDQKPDEGLPQSNSMSDVSKYNNKLADLKENVIPSLSESKVSDEISPPLISTPPKPPPDQSLDGGSDTESEDIAITPHKPKPPPRAPEYLGPKVRGQVEKSFEMLRQHRLSMQKHEQVLAELDDDKASGVGDKRVNDVVCELSDNNPSEQQIDLNEEENGEIQHNDVSVNSEEDGFIPRIICSPIMDVINDSEESSSDPKQPDKRTASENPVMIKQPVQFMSVKEVISSAKSIDIQTAMDLKRLVLGSPSAAFPDNWLYQGFTFCDLPSCLFGLLQHSPGTCGLLAVVQAYFLIELIFCTGDAKGLPPESKLSPRSGVRSQRLAQAICKILWRCGEQKRAVLALPSDTTILTGGGRYRSDGITETLMINMIDNFDELLNYTQQFISCFEDDNSNGAILLLYSAVLSRGVTLVLDDLDDKDTTLIMDNGFCSRELVNLLLCGKAASNVFNDSMEISLSNGKTTVMKGIPTRSDIGYLSLEEHFNRKFQIGTFLKTPKYPIWIIHIEGHYSLVFCLNKDLISDWKAERRFDLIYHDNLARIDPPLTLTIDTTNRFFEPPEDDEQVPPLELCIRTKWRDAQIDWNGAEPILDSKSSRSDGLL